jgi:hypothetical protein
MRTVDLNGNVRSFFSRAARYAGASRGQRGNATNRRRTDRAIQLAYLPGSAYITEVAHRPAAFVEINMAQPNVEDLVQSIANDTGAPPETVSRMVAQTWQAFSDGAHITDFLPVLVTKRVREDLRNQRRPSHR